MLLSIETVGMTSFTWEKKETVCEATCNTDSIKKGSEQCENSVELYAFSEKVEWVKLKFFIQVKLHEHGSWLFL